MSEEYKRTKKEVELDLKIKQAELDQKLAEIEKTKAEVLPLPQPQRAATTRSCLPIALRI